MTRHDAHAPPRPGEADVELLDDLSRAVGEEHLIIDRALLAACETDATGCFGGRALCAVRPSSTEEVARILRICGRFNARRVERTAGRPARVRAGRRGFAVRRRRRSRWRRHSAARRRLWEYGEAINDTLRALGAVHKYDVSLPLERLAEFASTLRADLGRMPGLAKREHLSLTRSSAELSLMRDLKRAMDPAGILGAGRVLSPW